MLVVAKGLLGGLLVTVVTGKLELERAELLIDDLPYDFIRSHGGCGSKVVACGVSIVCLRRPTRKYSKGDYEILAMSGFLAEITDARHSMPQVVPQLP